MESGDTEEYFQTDVSSEVDDTQEDSSEGEDSSILPANMDDTVFHENRPVLDSFWSKKPTIEDDKQQIVENTELPEISLVNTRALLPKEATTYELESFEKHALVIFNQKNFKDPDLTRFGTEKDVEALTSTFENFSFEVKAHNDLTKREIFGELKEFSKRDFTDYGCVAVAILTHGEACGKLHAADQTYHEIDVINQFNVGDVNKSTLVSKPKIFIIQACRGETNSSGVSVLQSGNIRKDRGKNLTTPYILPLGSDLLILHSSYPGCTSHRNILHGSWFIQTLCKKIDTLSLTQDLESIITEVKREVAIDMAYYYEDRSTLDKQMPVMTSTLIRTLYLKKLGEREETYLDKSRRHSESRHEVLEVVSSSPMTPLLVPFGPCSCYLEHFTYMRNCLRYFVAENPNDETAQEILDVANTYNDSVEFNRPKEKLCKIMSKHLMDKARDSQSYKYLHFVPVDRKLIKSDNDKSNNAQNELSMSKSSFSSLGVCLTGIFAATFVFVLRNVKSN